MKGGKVQMEFVNVVLLTVILVFIAFIGLALKVLFKKDGKFPNTHVSGNKYLKRQGIYCAQAQDRIERSKVNKRINYKNVKIVDDKKA